MSQTSSRFGIGFVLGLLVAAGAALVVAFGVDPKATAIPGVLERLVATRALDRVRSREAPTGANPRGSGPDVIAAGADHYRENCVVCHGAPSVEASELAKGFSPEVPVLDSPGSQRLTDGELFWTIKNGIRMTGMPAFGPTHTDDEVWAIVAFVRHLPHITAEEQAALKSGSEDSEAHHH